MKALSIWRLASQGRVGSDEAGCGQGPPCPAGTNTAGFVQHAGHALLESAPFQAQRMLPWWFTASSATILCSLLKVSAAACEPPGMHAWFELAALLHHSTTSTRAGRACMPAALLQVVRLLAECPGRWLLPSRPFRRL